MWRAATPVSSLRNPAGLSPVCSGAAREVITEIRAGVGGNFLQRRHHVRIRFAHVVILPRISAQIVKTALNLKVFIHNPRATIATGLKSGIGPSGMGKYEFEVAVGDRLEAILPIIVIKSFAGLGAIVSLKQWQQADTIDLLLRQWRFGNRGYCGKDVYPGCKLVANQPILNYTFPHHQARHTLPALKGRTFAFAVPGSTSRVIPVVEPWPVIGSKYDKRVFIQPAFFERPDDLSYTPVNFHHHIAIQPLF